jgi:hypothetical protein
MAGYIGTIPVPQATQTRETFTATANQTSFSTGGYTPNFIDVFMNGVKLAPADFTATNGSDVVLASGAAANDIIDIVAFTAFQVLNQNFTGNTSTQDLTVSGNLTVTGSTITIDTATVQNVDLGDNDKIRMGDGDDLQIYHNGSASIIKDDGVGDLYVGGDNNILITNAALNETKGKFISNGAVELYHDNSKKFETTSAGVDVTGTITADGLIVDGTGKATFGSTNRYIQNPTGTELRIGADNSSGVITAYTNGSERMRINSNGTVLHTLDGQGNAFVPNTSSTWNALEIFQDRGVTNSASGIAFRSQSGTAPSGIVSVAGNTTGGIESLAFMTSSGNSTAERMRITSDGNVGIGDNSPSRNLTVSSSGQTDLAIIAGASSSAQLQFGDSSDDNIGQIEYNNSTDHMAFYTNASERMRIPSGGGLNITNGSIATSGDNYMYSYSGGSVGQVRSGIKFEGSTSTLEFYAGQNERMRIDGSGNLFVNATASKSGIARAFIEYSNMSQYGLELHATAASSAGQLIFYVNNNNVGGVISNTTSTAYNTSSDYRLKENVTDVTDGITRVKQLAPKRFNFIADADTTVDGFLAHEAATVVPEAVTGTKDAVMDEEYEVTAAVTDDDGNVVEEAVMGTRSVPDYQGIDQSKIVPLLTAALQEAIAKIETLETKVAALEAG